MKIAALTVSFSLLCGLAGPASFAATATPAATATSTTMATPAATTPMSGKAQRQSCRESLKAQNVSAADMKGKMQTCMAPARENCAKQAKEQNVAKGAARKDFMKKCMSS